MWIWYFALSLLSYSFSQASWICFRQWICLERVLWRGQAAGGAMYCLQWLIPVLLLPKPVSEVCHVRHCLGYVNYVFTVGSPVCSRFIKFKNHCLFNPTPTDFFWRELIGVTISGEPSIAVQPCDVHRALPDRLLLGAEALHHLLPGLHCGHGSHLLLWLRLLSVLELLLARGKFVAKIDRLAPVQWMEYLCIRLTLMFKVPSAGCRLSVWATVSVSSVLHVPSISCYPVLPRDPF